MHTAIVVAFAFGFMAVCYWLYQPWWERAFRSDDSPVSWLSSALLFANGIAALRLVLDGLVPLRLGSAMAAGLVLCALDEQFMFHERFKYRLVKPWFDDGVLSRILGDLPTVALGIGGAICVALFIRRMNRRASSACRLMLVALGIGIVALSVDLWNSVSWIAPLEEALEVSAEAVFLCALLAVRRDQVQSSS